MANGQAPYVMGRDGKKTFLGDEAYKVVQSVLAAFSGRQEMLTTGEAAAILGVSAKTVARMLDAGEMKSERRGISGHRMVSASEVIAYRERSAKAREKNLTQARHIAFDSGAYDLDQGSIPTRTR